MLSTAVQAGWVETNEELKNQFLIPKICSEVVVSNETERNFDSDECIESSTIKVSKKYITNHQGSTVVTLMRLAIDVLGVTCEGKLKKTFATTYVNHRGEVIHKPASWEVIYVDNCELRENQIVLQATLEESHVKYLSPSAFSRVNKKTRERIEEFDLEIELESTLDYISTKYYRVMDPSNTRKRMGYFEVSNVRDLDSNETFEVLVRYDLHGFRIGELEY